MYNIFVFKKKIKFIHSYKVKIPKTKEKNGKKVNSQKLKLLL